MKTFQPTDAIRVATRVLTDEVDEATNLPSQDIFYDNSLQKMEPARQMKKWKVRARQGVVITEISELLTTIPCKRGFEENESRHIEKVKDRKFSTCSSKKVGQASLEWPQPSP
ncbi:conserved hypothetical protein [Ricinus communis]|uniref:Uncharacterized protein n=1 Tax=Ricinus communis TaxID=3988 RepID=B9SQJ7_RICCO|nr:conserved hypothetical protein [Ricinus communis]